MSFIIRVLFLLTLGFLAADGGDMLGVGRCPYVRAKDSVNRTALHGDAIWVEQRKYYRFLQNDRCALMVIDHKLDNGNLRVWYGYQGKWTPTRITNGMLYPVSKVNTTSKFLAHWPYQRNRYERWWILDTDYKNFLIVWTCSETYNWFSNRQLMILTRNFTVSDSILDGYKNIAYDRGAPVSSLGKTYSNGC